MKLIAGIFKIGQLDFGEGTKKATKIIQRLEKMLYHEKVQRLDLFIHSKRRLKGDLITEHEYFCGEKPLGTKVFSNPVEKGIAQSQWLELKIDKVNVEKRLWVFKSEGF